MLRVDWPVFPGRPMRPLSNMSMSMSLRRLKVKTAVHGTARSTFRDWAKDSAGFVTSPRPRSGVRSARSNELTGEATLRAAAGAHELMAKFCLPGRSYPGCNP